MRRLSAATWTLLLALAALLCWVLAVHADPCWRAWVVAVVHVVDGDTFDLEVTWEPRHTSEERVRLLGVDTPELKGSTKVAGEAAKTFTAAWLATAGGMDVIVCTPARDSFGRLLARVVSRTAGDLSAALLAAGHAVPYTK